MKLSNLKLTIKAHTVKIQPHFFEALVDGRKTFEVRFNDRDYQVDDLLLLVKLADDHETLTNSAARAEISYVLTHDDFEGVAPGYVVLGLKEVREL